MFTAIDKIGNKVWIESAIENEEYYCSCCSQPVMQRRGSKRAHHFAHFGDRKGYSPCTDRWSYDMTEWHKSWQAQFPTENIEVVIENNGEKHRADVCIGKTVIEFQHSNISVAEFRKRNSFYTSAGYDVIWVFDVVEQYEEGQIDDEYESGKYSWKRVKTPFKDINQISDENATVYFQMSKTNDECEGCIERVKNSYKNFRLFYTDDDNYIFLSDFAKQANQNARKLVKTFSNGQSVTINIDTIDGKTIDELWQSNYSGMVVTNLSNNQRMIINGKHGKINTKNNRIIGYYDNLKNGKYVRSHKWYIVKDAYEPIWVLNHPFEEKNMPNEAEYQQSENIETSKLENMLPNYNSISTQESETEASFNEKGICANGESKNVVDNIQAYYYTTNFLSGKKEQYSAQNFQPSKTEFAETGESIINLFMEDSSADNVKVKCLLNNKVYGLKFIDGKGGHFELYEYNTTTKSVASINCKAEVTKYLKENSKNIVTSAVWELYNDETV